MRISDWSSDVCSSDLRDVVGEGEDVLIIAVVPFERDLDADIVALAGDRDRIGEQRRLGAIEPFDESRDAAFVMQLDFLALLAAFVGEDDADSRTEDGPFAISVFGLVERSAEGGVWERG